MPLLCIGIPPGGGYIGAMPPDIGCGCEPPGIGAPSGPSGAIIGAPIGGCGTPPTPGTGGGPPPGPPPDIGPIGAIIGTGTPGMTFGGIGGAPGTDAEGVGTEKALAAGIGVAAWVSSRTAPASPETDA